MEKSAQFAAHINAQFGKQLARVRRVKNISQAELARRMGVSRATIANLERGRQNVQLHQMYSLASHLDAPVSELMPAMRELTLSPMPPDALFLEIAKARLTAVTGGDK